jgi:hypothetical protein
MSLPGAVPNIAFAEGGITFLFISKMSVSAAYVTDAANCRLQNDAFTF